MTGTPPPLAALVPKPWVNLTCFHGVFAPSGIHRAQMTMPNGAEAVGRHVKTADVEEPGEVVDVTGHLGGHNFQWAWASGVAAGSNA